jgi:hypothetical protein
LSFSILANCIEHCGLKVIKNISLSASKEPILSAKEFVQAEHAPEHSKQNVTMRNNRRTFPTFGSPTIPFFKAAVTTELLKVLLCLVCGMWCVNFKVPHIDLSTDGDPNDMNVLLMGFWQNRAEFCRNLPDVAIRVATHTDLACPACRAILSCRRSFSFGLF